jgi:hypothetical protein
MDPLQSASFGGWPDLEELSPVALPAPRDGRVTVTFPEMPDAPRHSPGWISSVVPIPAPPAPLKFPTTAAPVETSKPVQVWPTSTGNNTIPIAGGVNNPAWTRGLPGRGPIGGFRGGVATYSAFPRG